MSIRPNLFFGMGFGFKSKVVYPAWSSLSSRVYSVGITAGRESRLDDFLPGELTAQLKNNDGNLLPTSTRSPYRSGGVTQVIPGVPVLFGEGFRGRIMLATPQMYFHLDGATSPMRDPAGGLRTFVVGTQPTYRSASFLGRGTLFNGRTGSFCLASPLTNTTEPALHTASTGVTILAAVRIDEKNQTRKQAMFQGLSTAFGGPLPVAETGWSLTFTTLNQARLWGRSGTVNSTLLVAISTGSHLLVGVFRKGSKPVLYIDGSPTSGAAASTGTFVPPQQMGIGGVGASSASSNRMFKGIVEEVAWWTNRGLVASEVASIYAQYTNKWRPGRIHFRGSVDVIDGYAYAFDSGKGKGPSRESMLTVKSIDFLGQVAGHEVPSFGPSSYTTPLKTFAGDFSNGRIIHILDKGKQRRPLRFLDGGAVTCLATSLGKNALALCQEAAQAENGAFYASNEGPLLFDNKTRLFTSPDMTVAQSTFSSQSSRPGYINPIFGYGRLIRNLVTMNNTTYTTSVQSTASQDTYGISSTDLADQINANAPEMVENARYILAGYSTARYSINGFSVLPLESTATYTQMCFRKLRDVVKLKHLAPGTTKLSTSLVSIEKMQQTWARQQYTVTIGCDAANRWSTITPSTALIILDSTVASHRLNTGRLSF